MKINISKIIQQIYKSEIPVRIEFMYDMGFCWSLIDETIFPRIFYDFKLEGVAKENILTKDKVPVSEKDWIAKGVTQSFDDAIKKLSEAIIEYLPESNFAEWWRSIN